MADNLRTDDADPAGRPLVVVADDDALRRHDIAALLHPEFRVQPVVGAEALMSVVASMAPDAVLLGVDEDAMARLRALRAAAGPRAPVIAIGPRELVDGLLAAGAADALTDTFTAAELRVRVRLQTELVRMRRRVAAAAPVRDHDPLTGLPNRRRFAEEFERVLAECGRYDEDAALVLLDVDGLEHVNDTHGHARGDQVLAGVAELIRARLRDTDVAARLSGDEFVLLLPRTDGASAVRLTTELLERIRRSTPLLSDAAARVTASAGVARVLIDGLVQSADEALLQADEALHAAKEAGRDRVALSDGPPAGGGRPRRERVAQIRRALLSGGLELHAQPILGLAGDRRARHELLLRLRDDDGALVTPGAFLLDAERTDLILDIDRWVISRGCEMLAEHQAVDPGLVFHLNLSARTITHPEIPGLIARELDRTGAAGSGLVFEITETSAITCIDRARLLSETLRALGCGLALDDFGAGFASFAYLKHLDFDFVKIDGELIRDVAHDRRDQRILSCIVDLAHALEKQSIAECVADQETLELVTAYDVDFVQGFHIARPAPLPVAC